MVIYSKRIWADPLVASPDFYDSALPNMLNVVHIQTCDFKCMAHAPPPRPLCTIRVQKSEDLLTTTCRDSMDWCAPPPPHIHSPLLSGIYISLFGIVVHFTVLPRPLNDLLSSIQPSNHIGQLVWLDART